MKAIRDQYIESIHGGDRIQAEKLSRMCFEVFKKLQMPDEDARIMADTLVDTDLRGVYSHGTMRFPTLVKRIETKVNNPRAKITVTRDNKAIALIDGDNGMGQVVSWKAMDIAIAKAKEYGISGVGVFHSNHSNAMSTYAMRALQHDMIGFYIQTGAGNVMAPWGGFDTRLGNNPFGIAIPTGNKWGFPVVLDMACSKNARGYIVLAMKEGKTTIPEDFALDENGDPTTDPTKAYRGTVLPLAEYKGYGLAMVMGILGSVLTGAAIGKDVRDFYEDFIHEENVGHFMGAINIDSFIPVERFKENMDELIGYVKSSRIRKNFSKIYVPGEKEYEAYKENKERGIPIAPVTLDSLRAVAAKYSVEF